jgi:hypothetical protein
MVLIMLSLLVELHISFRNDRATTHVRRKRDFMRMFSGRIVQIALIARRRRCKITGEIPCPAARRREFGTRK